MIPSASNNSTEYFEDVGVLVRYRDEDSFGESAAFTAGVFAASRGVRRLSRCCGTLDKDAVRRLRI